MSILSYKDKVIGGFTSDARAVNFDKTGTALECTNVEDVIKEINTKTEELNTNLENKPSGYILKDIIVYNGTIGSDHLIDISSKLPVDKPYVVIPIQWGYERLDTGDKLFGNCFASGYLCDCRYNNSLKQLCLIPRDSKRIETFNNLFVYYWVQLAD